MRTHLQLVYKINSFSFSIRSIGASSLIPRLDLLGPSILVSTKLRSFIHRIDGNRDNGVQIGTKPRKAPGPQGACFVLSSGNFVADAFCIEVSL